MTDHKRDSERIHVAGDVTGEVSVYEPMVILDLSECGARVETPFAMHLGSLHEFRVSLGELSVVVKGRIVHSQIGGLGEAAIIYRSGVEFVDASEHVVTALRAFVGEQRASHPAPHVIDAEISDEY